MSRSSLLPMRPLVFCLPLLVAGGLFFSVGTNANSAERPAWDASRFVGTPEPPPEYETVRVWPGLTLKSPVLLEAVPGTRLVVLGELGGRVLCFDPERASDQDATSFLTVPPPVAENGERGQARLYGLCFGPDFSETPEVFVCYRETLTKEHRQFLARVPVVIPEGDDAHPHADWERAQRILSWEAGGHDAGDLAFGTDGMLYVSTGDTEVPSPPDPKATGQDLSDLLSSVLRIDVRGGTDEEPYQIPSDNPFVGRENIRPEIWAYGFRNPWRIAMRPGTNDLWLGDVGWEQWEMIHRVRKGGNYGWSVMEGPQPVRTELKTGPTPIQAPLIAYPHALGQSVTGGEFYSGTRLPGLADDYIYGDFVTGLIWACTPTDEGYTNHRLIANSGLDVVSFGTGPDGELYLLGYRSNELHQLQRRAEQSSDTVPFPTTLSETGLFQDVAAHQLTAGVTPYDVAVPMWEDGANATRFVALPTVEPLTLKGRTFVDFPTGTVFGRTLTLPPTNRRIETQLLHYDGSAWNGYVYKWRDDGSDADLVGSEGESLTLSLTDAEADHLASDGPLPQHRVTELPWRLHSRADCNACHQKRTRNVISFRPEQLMSSWDRLRAANVIAADFPSEATPWPKPERKWQEVELSARAWLDVNCATCHQRGAGGTAQIDLRADIKLENAKLIGHPPVQGTLGLSDPQLIRPRTPSRSVLFYRVATAGRGHMPKIGSARVDLDGLRLLNAWIGNQMELPPTSDPKAEPEPTPRTVALATLSELWTLEPDPHAAEVMRERIEQITDPEARLLFAWFTGEDATAGRLGESFDASEVLSLTGRSEAGRRLWFGSEYVTCRSCHPVDGDEKLGPNLTSIAQRMPMAEVLTHIVDPSKTIDEKYVAVTVVLTDGRTLDGLLSAATAENETRTVLTADGRSVTVAESDIDDVVRQKVSLMPRGLLKDLTAQEAADLLAWITSQRPGSEVSEEP